MLLQQRLGLKLTQKPVLTQSLRQLVKLLALNRQELKEEINQELVENPVLEVAEGEDATDGSAAEGGSSDDKEGGPEADSQDSDKDSFDEIDFDSFFKDYLDPGYRSPLGEVSERPSFETFLSSPSTLTDHLLWQLSLSDATPAVKEAAEAIIGNLDEDGYLQASSDEICESAAARPADVEQALALVQEFDPLGVAARDLRECLLIQLGRANGGHHLACRVVEEHLSDLQDADHQRIAASLGLPLKEVECAIGEIKGLDPRPGQQYNTNSARTVEPDVYFVKTPQGFRVVLNEDDLPDLRLSRHYRRMLTQNSQSREVRSYVKERYNSAIQLLRNIEQRRQTIRSVCDAIVRRQPDFLSMGLDHLRPMMIKDVAEEIGVHPSTVSRAVANKYAHTPHGVHELRFFFSEAVQGPSGGNMPLILLKRKVKKMIEDEDATRPLTDDRISQMLREEGIFVTRRTVAKYREDMGIPSTHRRRKRA